MNKELAEKLKSLKEYFEKRPDVEMAFLFGSRAKGQETSESDADVAVYFKTTSGHLEFEDDTEYEDENKVWGDVEKILGISTDLVVLNRAPATLADSIIREGEPIIIKNQKLYLDFLLRATSNATDFREFVKDFWEIKQRSQSLSPQDKERLTRIIDFLETEIIEKLPIILNCDKNIALNIAEFTRLRNVLAHEYLDMRFNQIKKFIDDAQ